MSQPINAPQIFLAQRENIAELLRYQVWADAQLRRHLGRVKHCVEMTRLGRMTSAGARERLAIIARSMHAAVREFSRIAHSLFDPASQYLRVRSTHAVPVPHGAFDEQPHRSWKEWQWKATHPPAGCLAFNVDEWNEQRAVADLWVQRNVHRALAVRATGEYLALRLDGLDRASSMSEELFAQLRFSSDDFWAKFELAECAGVRRENLKQFAA